LDDGLTDFCRLSNADDVVIIGHGSGCSAVMQLVNHRGEQLSHSLSITPANLADVDRKVKAVIQVAGMHSLVRIDPEHESRRNWFRTVRSL
jgi:histone deacetylase 6